MKKIYLCAAFMLICILMDAQAFWSHTTYKGAFPVTDNTTATDWIEGWTNWDPENTNYGAPTQTINTDITTSTSWSGIILLQNKVYVKNNAVLTIQPGTVIRGDKTSQGTLIITRGSKIMANGTAQNPIVFTSNEAPGNRAEGDWGGLVILGKARNNQPNGVANIEGIAPTSDTEFGGTDDNDNSGELGYIRIEFAGIPLQPNKEINGLTFGSVGKQTKVHHIQVSLCGDDSFEWFGGTVDAKYLISYRALDDDFDTDFGYSGRVQFGLIIRDKDLSDAAGDSNAFESDNDATGSSAQPLTKPIFSNFTIVGPKGDGSILLPAGEKFEKAFRLRRNTATSVYNSIITGWEKGLSIEGPATEDNFSGDTANFMGNLFINLPAGNNVVSASTGFYASWFAADGNDTMKTLTDVSWVNPFASHGNKSDYRLHAGSVAASGAMFPASVFGTNFVGMEENNYANKLSIYPNPATTETTLNIELPYNTNIRMIVTDIRGQTVFSDQQTLKAGSNKWHLRTTHLHPGLYFLTLESTEGKETVKFMVRQ